MSSDYRLMWEAAGGSTPDHWDFIAIERLLETPKSITVGVMYPGNDTPGGTPLVRVSDVKNGAIASQPDFRISSEVNEEYKRTRLNGTELLVTLVGNPGDCVIATNDMLGWNVARALAVIRLADIELRPWIRYVLLSKPAKHLIDARLNTTVQKTLNLKDIKELGIPIPPREERIKVTTAIDAIEAKCLVNRKTNQTLEQIAQALFKSWFIDFEPTRAKIFAKEAGASPEEIERAAMCAISGKTPDQLAQLPPETQQNLKTTAVLFPDSWVDSEVGEVPNNWIVETIESVTEMIIDHRGKTPSKMEGEWSMEGYPAVSAKNIKNGRITNHNSIRYVDEDLYKRWMKDELKIGDILLTSEAPMGELFLIADETKYCLSQRLFALRANTKIVTPTFLYMWLNSPFAKSELEGRTTGTTVVGIRQSELRKVKVLRPALDICIAFEKIAFPLHKQLNSIENQNIHLENTRDLILPWLLSGTLTV